MSIAQQNRIQMLEGQVAVLEERVDILYQLLDAITSDKKPRDVVVIEPEKRKSA